MWFLCPVCRFCRFTSKCKTGNFELLYVDVSGFYLTEGVVPVSCGKMAFECVAEPFCIARPERVVSEGFCEVEVQCRSSFHDGLQDYASLHVCPFAHQGVERVTCLLEVLDYLALRRRLKA